MKKTLNAPWKPGQSGNPNGRPKGTGEVAKLRAGIAKHVPTIVERLVTQAEGGDVQAARLLLERVIPPMKAAEATAPIAMAGETLVEQGQAVLSAAAAGQLAPGQASQLLAGLAALAKLIETQDLEARISALEAKGGKTT